MNIFKYPNDIKYLIPPNFDCFVPYYMQPEFNLKINMGC